MKNGFVFLDCFTTLDELNSEQRRDPKAILRSLARSGRFSCFDVDKSMAKAMTWLLNESGWVKCFGTEIVTDDDGHGSRVRDMYPWTKVEITPAGRLILDEANT